MFSPENLTSIIIAFVGGSAFKILVDAVMSRFREDPNRLIFQTLMEANQKQAERIAILERENMNLRTQFSQLQKEIHRPRTVVRAKKKPKSKPESAAQ